MIMPSINPDKTGLAVVDNFRRGKVEKKKEKKKREKKERKDKKIVILN